MIHYVVFDPITGAILRFGHCAPEDMAVHGDHVLAFEADPGATDASHLIDAATRTLIALES